MQVCTSLQTDNHASTPPLSFFTDRMPFLPPNQQRQSTEGTNDEDKLDIAKLRLELPYQHNMPSSSELQAREIPSSFIPTSRHF